MAQDAAQHPKRYRLRESARRHGLSEWTLRQAAKEKRVEFFQIGNRQLFTDEAVSKFLDSVRQPVAA